MPANIDYAPNAGIVLDNDGGVVLYCILMNGMGKCAVADRIAEQIIHQVNAMEAISYKGPPPAISGSMNQLRSSSGPGQNQ